MNSAHNLAKKTVIYALGNIGSRVLAYIMVLVYSHFIDPTDLGYYDLILTTVSMIMPIIMVEIQESVYRFLIESRNEEIEILLKTSFVFLCITSLISILVFLLLNSYFKFEYASWIIGYFLSLVFYTYYHEAIRGLGETKKYAMIGILNSTLLLVTEIIGLIIFKLGVLALLSANVASMAFSILIMVLLQKEFIILFKRRMDIGILKKLLLYSAPLVPNTICWWIVNSSDRYIILWSLGSMCNGIYSISNKFPTVLTTITSIFYLAWQEEAIKTYNTCDRDKYFSNIFEKYSTLLFTLCLCAIPMTHIVINYSVGTQYRSAWLYSGFLYLGAVFSALSSFLGLGYQISKETHRSMLSTMSAAVINITVNICLVNKIGLQSASFSTFVAYLFLFVVRVKHSKKYYNVHVNWKSFYSLLLVNLICLIVITIAHNVVLSIVTVILSVIYAYFKNEYILKNIRKNLTIV